MWVLYLWHVYWFRLVQLIQDVALAFWFPDSWFLNRYRFIKFWSISQRRQNNPNTSIYIVDTVAKQKLIGSFVNPFLFWLYLYQKWHFNSQIRSCFLHKATRLYWTAEGCVSNRSVENRALSHLLKSMCLVQIGLRCLYCYTSVE